MICNEILWEHVWWFHYSGDSLVWISGDTILRPQEDVDNAFVYEDRTSCFFPPAPRIPRMPGLGAGDAGFIDDYEDTFHELSTSPSQHFNVLSSGDKDGSICFSIFGIFPIGKIVSHSSRPCLFDLTLITLNACEDS